MNQFQCFNNLNLIHGITTKKGGISQGVYAEMNTGFFGDDDMNVVYSNIKRALDHIGATAKLIVATQQIHSNNILVIDSTTELSSLKQMDVSKSDLKDYNLYVAANCDGLMTNRDDVILMTFYADCVPLVFYDPIRKVAASVHSGWRGTANQIASTAVDLMKSRYECSERDIYAGIGQSAGSCCYEIDEPVIKAFKINFKQSELEDFITPKDNGRFYIDLKQANALILMRCGLKTGHIEINFDCTICGSDMYHSHRRSNGNPRGSMSAFVQIKK